MKVVKFKQKDYTVNMEIEEDISKLEGAKETAFKELVKDAKIPGFRPGKAPRKIYEDYYGTGAIIERATTLLMNEAYRQAIAEKNIFPVDYPKNIDLKEIKEGQPFVFTLDVDVRPEVEIKKYKGLKGTTKKVVVTDEDVNKQIESAQNQFAEYKTAETDQKAENDSIVNYDIEAKVDGEVYKELTRENAGARLGMNIIHEEFDKNLMGMKANEEKTFAISFDDKAKDEKLKGKKVEFKVKLKEIRTKQLPELNDEFVQKISDKKTVAELKALIKENLTKSNEQQEKTKLENSLLEELVKENDFEIPHIMIHDELHRMQHDIERDLQRSRLNFESYLQYMGKTKDDWEKENHDNAARRVKVNLLLGALIKKEKIEPTDAEIQTEFDKMVESLPEKDRAQAKEKGIPESTKDYIKYYLSERKAIDYVVENAKVGIEK
jgi:trigger factor